jgi:hypothetical protein
MNNIEEKSSLIKMFDPSNNLFSNLIEYLSFSDLIKLPILNKSLYNAYKSNEQFQKIRLIFLGLLDLPLFLGIKTRCGEGDNLAKYCIQDISSGDVLSKIRGFLSTLGFILKEDDDEIEIINNNPRIGARVNQSMCRQRVCWNYEGIMDQGNWKKINADELDSEIIYQEKVGNKTSHEQLTLSAENKQLSISVTIKAFFDHINKYHPLIDYNKIKQSAKILRLDHIELVVPTVSSALKSAIEIFNKLCHDRNLKEDEEYFASLDTGKIDFSIDVISQT